MSYELIVFVIAILCKELQNNVDKYGKQAGGYQDHLRDAITAFGAIKRSW
jgi:hypothetical protein